jgi:hypothetical protein
MESLDSLHYQLQYEYMMIYVYHTVVARLHAKVQGSLKYGIHIRRKSY